MFSSLNFYFSLFSSMRPSIFVQLEAVAIPRMELQNISNISHPIEEVASLR